MPLSLLATALCTINHISEDFDQHRQYSTLLWIYPPDDLLLTCLPPVLPEIQFEIHFEFYDKSLCENKHGPRKFSERWTFVNLEFSTHKSLQKTNRVYWRVSPTFIPKERDQCGRLLRKSLEVRSKRVGEFV